MMTGLGFAAALPAMSRVRRGTPVTSFLGARSWSCAIPQRAPRLLASTCQVVAPLAFMLLALTYTEAHAQARGGLESSPPLLDLLYLVVIEPLLPLLAGAGLFMLTRSHLVAAGLSALGFGAWGALYFSRLSLDGPLSGAL
jgi:hypothetical protein